MPRIQFNGVHKSPGRPTLVDGPEGRKYVASKILNNLAATQKNGEYRASTTDYGSQFRYEPGQDFEYGLDEYGMATESLQPSAPLPAAMNQIELELMGQPIEAKPAAFASFKMSGVVASDNLETQDQSMETQGQAMLTPEEALDQEPGLPEEGFQIGETVRAIIESGCDDIDDYFDYDEDVFDRDDNLYALYAANLLVAHSDASLAVRNKTGILRIPAYGVVRSSRGTVELLVHANGRTFTPRYNLCGILIGVAMSDGYTIATTARGKWRIYDPQGKPIQEESIHTVAFDKKGNLWYQTRTGKTVTFFVDGTADVVAA